MLLHCVVVTVELNRQAQHLRTDAVALRYNRNATANPPYGRATSASSGMG